METWKDVPDWEKYYQVSNKGRVKSKDRVVTKYCGLHNKVVTQRYKGFIRKPSIDKDGRPFVTLSKNKQKFSTSVARLVLMAFVGMPEDGQECCHNDGDATNNNLENLRWDTHKENNRDRIRHDTYKTGTDHHFSKFSEDLINKIKTKKITKQEALRQGVSNTHYYRIINGKR